MSNCAATDRTKPRETSAAALRASAWPHTGLRDRAFRATKPFRCHFLQQPVPCSESLSLYDQDKHKNFSAEPSAAQGSPPARRNAAGPTGTPLPRRGEPSLPKDGDFGEPGPGPPRGLQRRYSTRSLTERDGPCACVCVPGFPPSRPSERVPAAGLRGRQCSG